jgi:hypothetical protein
MVGGGERRSSAERFRERWQWWGRQTQRGIVGDCDRDRAWPSVAEGDVGDHPPDIWYPPACPPLFTQTAADAAALLPANEKYRPWVNKVFALFFFQIVSFLVLETVSLDLIAHLHFHPIPTCLSGSRYKVAF